MKMLNICLIRSAFCFFAILINTFNVKCQVFSCAKLLEMLKNPPKNIDVSYNFLVMDQSKPYVNGPFDVDVFYRIISDEADVSDKDYDYRGGCYAGIGFSNFSSSFKLNKRKLFYRLNDRSQFIAFENDLLDEFFVLQNIKFSSTLFTKKYVRSKDNFIVTVVMQSPKQQIKKYNCYDIFLESY